MKNKLKYFLFSVYGISLILGIYLLTKSSNYIPFHNIAYFTIILIITNNFTLFFNSVNSFITSINLPVLFPAMVLLDPFWVALISFFGSIELKQRKNFVWYKFLFNRTMLFSAAGIAALVFKLTINYFNSSFILAFFFSSLCYFIINNGLMFIVISIAEEEQDTSFSYFIQLGKNLVISYFLGLLLYYSYMYFGMVFFILVILFLFVIKDVVYSNIRQLNSFTQIIESFLKVIDSKDHYTEGHCERVAKYTKTLCNNLNISIAKTERIVNLSKIHDIGKIKVPDHILKSTNKLNNKEYKKIKKHSIYGYEILKDINIIKEDVEIILYHHEWYDGSGYPEGLSGKEIPVGSRILSICDAFDVMTTGRNYKPAMNKKEVIAEFERCSNIQFDPKLTNKMIALIKKGKFDHAFEKRQEEVLMDVQ